jgi:tripartite-type tricarboxylate transporter receptor subunit TctC
LRGGLLEARLEEAVKLGRLFSFVLAGLLAAIPAARSQDYPLRPITLIVPFAAAPDIPPIAEAGVPGFDASCRQMIVAPAATPKEIVDKLHGEFAAVMALSDIRDRIEKVGLIPVDSPPPEELKRFLERETTRWGRIVHQAGLAGPEL